MTSLFDSLSDSYYIGTRFDVGVKNSFDTLLVYSKMTALPNVPTVCVGDHYISVGPTSNFIPFYSPWMLLLPPLAHQEACFRVVHSW
jgi:hypothetical protein